MKWLVKFTYIDGFHFLEDPIVNCEIEFNTRQEAVLGLNKMKETEYRLYNNGKRWNRYTEISLWNGDRKIYQHNFRYEREKKQ